MLSLHADWSILSTPPNIPKARRLLNIVACKDSLVDLLQKSLNGVFANMKGSMARPARFVCQMCQLSKKLPTIRTFSVHGQPVVKQPIARSAIYIEPAHKKQRRSYAAVSAAKLPAESRAPQAPSKAPPTTTIANVGEILKWITHTSREIISSDVVPDELTILEILVKSQEVANIITFGTLEQPQSEATFEKRKRPPATGSTSSLLDLEDEEENTYRATVSSSSELSVATRQRSASSISSTIYDLLHDHKVFITPDALNFYTRVQLLLGSPKYLPEIFDLYATKAIPKAGSSPVTYSKSWRPHPRNAIDMKLSDAALEAAIAKKDLPLALAIIDTTVATPSFRFAKVLRKAALPLAAWAALPFVAYTGADWVANYQNTMDEAQARTIVLAASGAYIATLSIIGFTAVTTHNDQMERVSWQPGYRLRDRWLHEEERLYFDRVAMAWGFKEKWRRGEEQGEEWEALREFLGMRMMVLDKTSLLEGME